jgi:ribonuclease G
MIRDILIQVDEERARLALLEDGELAELHVEPERERRVSGDIYLGRVTNVLSGIDAAFVDIGIDKNAFLSTRDISAKIAGSLRPGHEILVQVKSEPAGDKGHSVSFFIDLPGRLTVLKPLSDVTGISLKINETDRARLLGEVSTLKPDGMGIVIRTAAEKAGRDELERDISALEKLWDALCLRAEHAVAPALIHREEGLERQAVRDMLSRDVRAFLLDDMARRDRALSAAEMMAPEFTRAIQYDVGETRLFDRYRVHSQIERALSPRVWLKSGGYLSFDYTEAMTVIDVNTGKFSGRHTPSDLVFDLNLEAAEEIALQLRLRNIGGIIIIDFIDMDCPGKRESLLEAFRRHLKKDRVSTKVLGFTALGFVEMTRRKTGTPLRFAIRTAQTGENRA